MNPRPITQWAEIFAQLDVKAPLAPDGAAVIARRIIGDLVGYQHGTRHLNHDTAELANALIAFSAFRPGGLDGL